MTRLYPATNGTPPNIWRDKAVIYPLSVVACLFITVLLVLVFWEARKV